MSFRIVLLSWLLSSPTFAADLTGRVIDAVTGKPVAKATVFAGHEKGLRLNTLTGADGSFHLTNLTPGEYMLLARASGYEIQRYGSPAPEVAGRALIVPDAAPVEFRLHPSATLSGTIVDEEGDTVAHTRLIALREFRTGGKLDYSEELAIEGDTTGEFQFPNLPPGQYVIVVHTAIWLPASGTQYGHLIHRVRLGRGQKLTNLRLTLPTVRVHKVTGRIIAPAGDEPKMYTPVLIPADTHPKLIPHLKQALRYHGSSGVFELEAAPEGSYTFYVFREDMQVREVALRTNIHIYSDRTDMLLAPNPLASLAGRIGFKLGAPTIPLQGLELHLQNLDNDLSETVRSIPVAEDGSFFVTNLATARYRITLSELRDVPLVLENDILDLSHAPPTPYTLRIAGRRPAITLQTGPAATLLLDLNGNATVLNNSSITLRLAPGEHHLIAFEAMTLDQAKDPALETTLKPKALKIQVEAGVNATYEVPTLR